MLAEQSKKKSNKASYWQEKVDGWINSGLTQGEFCKQNNLRFTTFSYWRSRLSIRQKSKEKPAMVPVEITASKKLFSPSYFRIKLPNGVLIEYPSNISNEQMKALFLSLSAIS